MVEKEEDQKEKVLEMTIEELDLSVRSYNCLKNRSESRRLADRLSCLRQQAYTHVLFEQ